MGRDRPDRARARRHARGRPDRGGGPDRARPGAAHDAPAPLGRRSPEPRAAAAPPGRGRARRRRLQRGLHVEPRRHRSRPGCDPPARSDERRSGDSPHDAARGPDRGREGECRCRQRGHRAVRARPRLPAERRAPARGALAGRRHRRGGFEAARGALEVLYETLHLEFRPEPRRAARSSTPARRRRPPQAGSGSSIRRCSRGRGACSSSISTS